MRRPHGYGESCPVAHALDLVGDRWALLVIRELRLGPRRFADLDRALPAIGPTTLTQRLRDLTQVGVLERTGAAARSADYALSRWGTELEPVFGALARWGARSPVVPLQGPISEDAVMLGVRTFAAGARPRRAAPRPDAAIEVRLTVERYRLAVAGGRLWDLRRTTRLPREPADATVATEPATLQALLTGRTSATVAAAESRLAGDRRLARWCLGIVGPRGRIAETDPG